MEPTIGAGLLSSKAQDEVAKCILTEGKTNVHEEYVLIASLVRILKNIPYGEDVRVYESK
jgi:hypothetical protein